MQASANTTTGAQPFPLRELEQLERAIAVGREYLSTLQLRHDALAAELERITRPATAAPRWIGPGFTYRGEMVRAWSAIDIHTGLLRRLWTDFPERREAMARAMAARGWCRVYVARSATELFPGKSETWARKHSRALVEGWMIDSNLNHARIRMLLRLAVATCNLKWGVDVLIYWRSERVQQ